MKRTKNIVCLPIEVPVGDYCWYYHHDFEGTLICGHFSNEGGHPKCDLNLDTGWNEMKYDDDKGGVKKPKKCHNLKLTFSQDKSQLA